MTKCLFMLCNRTMRDKRRAATTGGHMRQRIMAFYSFGDDHIPYKAHERTETQASTHTHARAQSIGQIACQWTRTLWSPIGFDHSVYI